MVRPILGGIGRVYYSVLNMVLTRRGQPFTGEYKLGILHRCYSSIILKVMAQSKTNNLIHTCKVKSGIKYNPGESKDYEKGKQSQR